jgi:hypothetical protein
MKMLASINLPGLLLMAFLYLIPAVQVLLTISGQYRHHGLLLGSLPYLERWPIASDIAFALMFAWPIWGTISGDPIEVLYFIPIYVLHQGLWVKRRLAKPAPSE